MHDQMKRLYAVAQQLSQVEGKSAVARELNESPQTLNNWENRGISAAGILKAAEKFGCSSLWLKDGMGPMVQGSAERTSPPGEPPVSVASTGYASSDTTFVRAPVVEWARLGAELLKEAKDLEGSEWAAFVPNTTPSDLCKLVKVADDSLAPRIARGDMVAIDPRNLKPARDQVVLLRAKSDDTFLLRRFRPLAGDAFEVYGASGTVLDSERHGLEVVGVACGIKMHDI